VQLLGRQCEVAVFRRSECVTELSQAEFHKIFFGDKSIHIILSSLSVMKYLSCAHLYFLLEGVSGDDTQLIHH
jgi:hypothetical protein